MLPTKLIDFNRFTVSTAYYDSFCTLHQYIQVVKQLKILQINGIIKRTPLDSTCNLCSSLLINWFCHIKVELFMKH